MRLFKTPLFLALFLVLNAPLLWAVSYPKYVPHQVIVRLRSTPALPKAEMTASEAGIASADLGSLLQSVHATQIKKLYEDPGLQSQGSSSLNPPFAQSALNEYKSQLERTFVVSLDSDMSVEEVVAQLKARSDVDYCEPNHYLKPSRAPNDTAYANLWALQNTGQTGNKTTYDPSSGVAGRDIDAEAAWDTVTGSATIVVAVVDSGVELAHPDLSANLTTGWDFGDNDSNPNDDCFNSIDEYYTDGHGTHVAGSIAAIGNNGSGVTGVGWGVKVMPLKAATYQCFFPESAVASAINYAVDHGARVINISLGNDTDDVTIRNAVAAAVSAHVAVISAAGNESASVKSYPAAYPGVLAVAATDRNDTVASFSNFGSWVGLAAPGVAIYSTYLTAGGSYGYKSGTSMASPITAGVAALVLSRYPTLTGEEVITRLKASCENIDALNPNRVGQIGAGRLNAARAILSVSSILPTSGVRDQVVVATITGVSFQNSMLVQLTKSGETAVLGSSFTYLSRSSIRCQFDLTGVSTGSWSVLVTTGETTQTLPDSFTVEAISLSSISLSSAPNTGTTGDLTLTGNHFAAGMSVKLSKTGQTDILGQNLSVNSVTIATVSFNLAGVHGGRWDIVLTKGTAEYRVTRGFVITSDGFKVASLDPSRPYSLSVVGPQGVQSFEWPEGTLAQAIDLDLDASPLLAAVDTTKDPYAATGIGAELVPTPASVSFKKPFLMTLPYRLSDLTDPVNELSLTIARYNLSTGRWEPLVSQVDTNNKTVSARVSHLSLFALLQHTASTDLKKAIAFPNPFRSDRNHSRVVFDFLTAGSRVRVYDMAGGLVRDLPDDNSDGQITWDVKNESGRPVASGVYFYVVTDPKGNKDVGRIGVIR